MTKRTIVLVMIGTIVLAVTVIVGLYVGGWPWVARNVLPVVGGGAIGVLIGRVLLWRAAKDRRNQLPEKDGEP